MSATYIHIHAPQPTERKLIKVLCPVCDKRRYFIAYFREWYGWDTTCLKCGDEWHDGEMALRPFMRGWRKKSIEAAKKRWRAIGSK